MYFLERGDNNTKVAKRSNKLQQFQKQILNVSLQVDDECEVLMLEIYLAFKLLMGLKISFQEYR